jgi:Rod binding domain-containing protein
MDTSSPLPTQTAAPSVDPAAQRPAASAADVASAHGAAQDFEAFFLSQTFENMFAGVGTDQMFGGGNGETVYRSLLLQEYSKVAAKAGGIGIADAVQREMLRAQESK